MKIIRPTEAVVEFESYREAAEVIARYTCPASAFGAAPGRGWDASPLNLRGEPTENRAVIREAIRVVAARFGVALPESPSPIGPPRPTYISGSDPDKVYDLRTMPTRYMLNVLNMDSERQAKGLRREIRAELRRRGERA